jgi:two-component system sensor histidine kinase KdpD
MLNEGRRRATRGTDVVVGFVETHGRPRTAEQIGDLPVVPRRSIEYRGTTFEEMDVDAILARHPQVALVDELAHTNVPGSRNEKRWQDVQELLDAGIDVISTVNIQHLESINDVVEQITGIKQRETIPDDAVRSADQIELVDMTPEALRRRMAHGNVYAAEKIDAALGNYFRAGNLGALRELALLWVADRVDDALEEYRTRHGITQPWEYRERVVVAITGAPGSEHLIRRAARIAQRAHGELLGLHVQAETGLEDQPTDLVTEHRKLLEEVGGEFREISAHDVADALLDFARAENATQIVLGASRRSRLQELTQGSVINRVIRMSGAIDVHVISADSAAQSAGLRLPRRSLSSLSKRRQAWGWALGAVGLPMLTLVLAHSRSVVGLPGALLLYLLLVLGVALVGGVLPAAASAIAAFLLANWYFTPPFYELTIGETENLLALLAFVLVAGAVSALVDRVARTRLEAARARAEAEAMAALAGMLAEEEALPALVTHLRATFSMKSAAVLRQEADGWHVEAADGVPVPESPSAANVVKELNRDMVLAMVGRTVAPEEHRVLNALAGQLSAAIDAKRLKVDAARATALAAANDLRTALLQAVSHDLRTPLASIKASISSLRQRDVQWSQAEIDEFNATIETETDRLDDLVTNLLDMSRLQAGALSVNPRPVVLDEVLPAAVSSLGPRALAVVVDVPEDVPLVAADPALLERAIANVVDNAVSASPPDQKVRVEAGPVAERVDIRVVDRGPGIPPHERERLLQPFQRMVDYGSGVGLGLAIAHGFVTAMKGEFTIEDTPGGGVTLVISLPRADG